MSKELAEFFYDQCCGQHAGHMAMLPNNPVLHSLMRGLGVISPNNVGNNEREKFAEMLRQLAYELETTSSATDDVPF